MLVSVTTKNGRKQGVLAGQVILSATSTKTRAMIKTLEVITEAIRDPNHPFRKADNQPRKPQKHRYERRKIKEYLHLADWQAEPAT